MMADIYAHPLEDFYSAVRYSIIRDSILRSLLLTEWQFRLPCTAWTFPC